MTPLSIALWKGLGTALGGGKGGLGHQAIERALCLKLPHREVHRPWLSRTSGFVEAILSEATGLSA
jgi:hypothetical protein